VLGLAAPARGAAFLARGVVSAGRKTSRIVIARTIIDGSTSDMREASGVSDGKLARRLTGKATFWACAEPVAFLPHAPAATKRTSPRQRCWTRHFVKTSTDDIVPVGISLLGKHGRSRTGLRRPQAGCAPHSLRKLRRLPKRSRIITSPCRIPGRGFSRIGGTANDNDNQTEDP
jgi:hypothetical protein